MTSDKEKVWKRLSKPAIDLTKLLAFNANGTKLTVNGVSYTLSTPWDSSTATVVK